MDWLLSRQDAIEKNWRPGTWSPAGWHCPVCHQRRWKGIAARWGRSGIPRREENGSRSSSAWSPAGPGSGRDPVFAGTPRFGRVRGVVPVVGTIGLGEVSWPATAGRYPVRIRQLKELPGAGWITALRAPSIAALARDDGPLQMSLFDDQNFAEITDARYPGERLLCCRKSALAAPRAAERESLLAATGKELDVIRASVQAGPLKGADKIGVKVGKVINSARSASTSSPISRTSAFPGGGMTRKSPRRRSWTGSTSSHLRRGGKARAAESVEAYKDLRNLERDFWSMKAEDIDLRPIFHYLENGSGPCVSACSPPTSLAPAPGARPAHFHQQQKPRREDPVSPAQVRHGNGEKTPRKSPRISSRPRLPRTNQHSGHPDQDTVSFNGRRLEKFSAPTPEQRRIFEQLGKPIRCASTQRNQRSHERRSPPGRTRRQNPRSATTIP